MLEYFDLLFVQQVRGVNYGLTIAVQVCALVLLLNDVKLTPKGIALKLVECAASCAIVLGLTAVSYSLMGTFNMDFFALSVFALGYGLFRSKYPPIRRLVLGSMYVACALVAYPISEPWGALLQSINESYFAWGQFVTTAVVVTLTLLEMVFLRRYSLPEKSSIHPQYVLCQVGLSLITIVLQLVFGIEGFYGIDEPIHTFNIVVSMSLWCINLVMYYLFFAISESTKENMILLSTEHKIELEREKYETNRVNYDELRQLRHEIKNHHFYMKALLDEKKYDELARFLEETANASNPVLQSFDCGNYIIDVIMNHELHTAREHGIAVDTDILVPQKLPFRDDDLCSLLSNLMDNAIEAAVSSASPHPSVSISIRPKQEYLFIRLVNSVSRDMPPARRLSLETTKQENREAHGFGTRIIRRIVEDYHGSIKYSMEDERFITDVMLEMQNTKEEKE